MASKGIFKLKLNWFDIEEISIEVFDSPYDGMIFRKNFHTFYEILGSYMAIVSEPAYVANFVSTTPAYLLVNADCNKIYKGKVVIPFHLIDDYEYVGTIRGFGEAKRNDPSV